MTAAPSLRRAPPDHLLAEAERFLTLYHEECGLPSLAERLAEVRDEVGRTGSYTLTSAELTHGARVAWRNSSRCVGRLPWAGLEVRDLRHVTRPDDVFAYLLTHLHDALNGGRVRPIISIFGPEVRVHNDQILRYAGYRQPGGRVIGDPQNVPLTEHVRRLGWAGGPGTPFDVLPLVIQAAGQVRLFPLPPDAAPQVLLSHPSCPAIADLGLRWFALPVLSGFALEVGGLTFPGAPFNGWYVQTEIAARNLADEARYNALPAVARALGLDMRRNRTLWRDRALVELNVAVLHSFDAAGVRISDHHSVSRQFIEFEAREAQAGREVRGRWSWLIPPLSPATTPIWHRQFTDGDERPAYRPQPAVWEELNHTGSCPVHG